MSNLYFLHSSCTAEQKMKYVNMMLLSSTCNLVDHSAQLTVHVGELGRRRHVLTPGPVQL